MRSYPSKGIRFMAYYSRDIYRSVLEPANSRLAGTGQVADELYLIAHHEVTGKPYLPPRALGAGLAGGLLAELMDAGTPMVTLRRGYLVPVRAASGAPAARHARIDEPVLRNVLELIIAEPAPRPPRDWLLFLGQSAATEVAWRLERAGYLTRPASRIPGRSRRPVPGDRDWAYSALLRAHSALHKARPPTPYAALLAGLTLACGLGFRFANLTDAPARSPGEAIRMLSPPLRELITHVQATADSALLSQRK
jgi:Golgi phosphoprotein 3 (GPP34)